MLHVHSEDRTLKRKKAAGGWEWDPTGGSY